METGKTNEMKIELLSDFVTGVLVLISGELLGDVWVWEFVAIVMLVFTMVCAAVALAAKLCKYAAKPLGQKKSRRIIARNCGRCVMRIVFCVILFSLLWNKAIETGANKDIYYNICSPIHSAGVKADMMARKILQIGDDLDMRDDDRLYD